MISVPDHGLSGPGSSSGRGNKVALSTQEYKCAPVICYGNLTNCGGSYSILASYIG